MKGKFMWASLLLCAGLWACTDDAIEGQQGTNGASGEGTPAYLTISFSANGGSSTRAVDGDEHGNADDSGHHSNGITGESAIKTALVVVSPQSTAADADGFAKVYTVNQTAGEGEFAVVDGETSTYTTQQPITINTGDYNVLVVLNPATTLSGTTYFPEGSEQVTENVGTVRNLYNAILTGNYSYTPEGSDENNYTNAANSIGMGVGYDGGTTTTVPQFMMANKETATVTVRQENTVDNPAQADVTVERVLSKITFREKAAASGTAANAYEVEVELGSAPAITTRGAIPTGTTGEPATTTYTIVTLNKAFDARNNDIYALYDEDGTLDGVYKDSGTEYNGDKTGETQTTINTFTLLEAKDTDAADFDATQHYAVVDADDNNTLDDDEIAASIRLDIDPNAQVESETWYVQLQGYSLVNLAKSVNYVRHTVGVSSAMQEPFGTLGTTRYLWTPNFEAKNALDLTTDFTNSIQTGWYYNSLKQVSDDSKALTVGTGGAIDYTQGTNDCYKAFTTLIDDDSEVDDETSPEPNTVGKLMTYCFENSTDANHQVHGLSTGVSFVARIYKDAACTQPIEKLYLYSGHNYTTLAQIEEAYGNVTPQAIKDLIQKEVAGTDITREELDAAGITLYNGNLCYYYTTEIKHFDAGNDSELGVNEFIIMRNNIYSLAVTTVNRIGSPFVDPTPNTPNESTEAALDIEVVLEPWIVRYNDIEF